MAVKVSIALITYNHVNFIKASLDSIFSQVVNFEYEVIIGDDCSFDGTRDILIDFSIKYNNIKLILQEKNVGSHQNETDVLNMCTGKYIALLEGDDYWTDPNKLQKQADLLDMDNSINLIYSDFSFINEDGFVIGHYKSPLVKANHLDILAGFCPKTATVVFRANRLSFPLPAQYYNVSYTDHFLFALITKGGYAVSNLENNANHRLHAGGSFGKVSPEIKYRKMIDNFLIFKTFFYQKEERKKINIGITRVYSLLLQHHVFSLRLIPLYKLLKEISIFSFEQKSFAIFNVILTLPKKIIIKIFKKILKFL